MANTTNLNLVKPAGTDYALVSVINGNMDIIDSKVGAIPANESAQSQITALNNQMTIDLGAVSGANLNEFIANASLAYIALNYKDKPHPVRVVWTNHDNYQGTMLATTNWVKFSLSTTNDLIYGNYTISGGTVTVGQVATKAGTITMESGFTSNLFIEKSANVVTVNGYIAATNAFPNAATLVGNIASGFRPTGSVRAVTAISSAAYEPGDTGYIVFDASGNVSIKAKAGNSYKIAYFSVSYCTT